MQEQICRYCRYSVWAVGVGRGFFCRNKHSEFCSPMITETGKHKCLSSRQHTCNLWESRHIQFVESIEDFDVYETENN